MVRFPIPECWIYLFRVEKHFRYGSVKSAHRRTGKIKGIERFLGAVDTLEPQLMEVTSGQAKYEHQHRAIVWRMPRLPKIGQGTTSTSSMFRFIFRPSLLRYLHSTRCDPILCVQFSGAYTTHQLTCKMALTSFDQIPENLAEYCYVEFTMPATQVSHTTARSVSVQNSDSDTPPEKYVRNLSRHEYRYDSTTLRQHQMSSIKDSRDNIYRHSSCRVGIEHTQGEGPGAYVAATAARKVPEATPEQHSEVSDVDPGAESDSDSSD